MSLLLVGTGAAVRQVDGRVPIGRQRENDGRRVVRRRGQVDPRLPGNAKAGHGPCHRSLVAGNQPGGLRCAALCSQAEKQGNTRFYNEIFFCFSFNRNAFIERAN